MLIPFYRHPVLLPTVEAVTQSNGFALAAAIMIGMLLALTYAGFTVMRAFLRDDDTPTSPNHRPPTADRRLPGIARSSPVGGRRMAAVGWHSVPWLALLGLGISLYLTFVETRLAPAFCGPIGDCVTVQNSPYARLFGVLPLGAVGGLGYAAILGAWLWRRFRSERLSGSVPLIVFCFALFGTLLSVYLTYLELFVIRAVCIWCLASAVLMTLLLLLGLGPMTVSITSQDDSTDADLTP